MIKVGILGAAGYTGGELIRLLLNHPEAEIVFANSESNAGNLVSDVHEVLCQVDNLDVGRDGVFLEESLTLAVSEAEEDNVNLVKRHLVGKRQIGIANQSLMDV